MVKIALVAEALAMKALIGSSVPLLADLDVANDLYPPDFPEDSQFPLKSLNTVEQPPLRTSSPTRSRYRWW